MILAEGKSIEQLRGIVEAIVADGAGALVSRPSPAQRRALLRRWGPGVTIRELAGGRLLRVPGPLGVAPIRGTVAVVTAGTSDVAVAEEAVAVLEELGIQVVRAYDVGVAGLHRLLRSLRRLEQSTPRAYLVFAGREGALPTVVAGLVRAPVVGVPTSIGYGRGAHGEAALSAMLQSCAPIAVVNIDAAVPAALFVALALLDRGPTPSPRKRRANAPHRPPSGLRRP